MCERARDSERASERERERVRAIPVFAAVRVRTRTSARARLPVRPPTCAFVRASGWACTGLSGSGLSRWPGLGKASVAF